MEHPTVSEKKKQLSQTSGVVGGDIDSSFSLDPCSSMFNILTSDLNQSLCYLLELSASSENLIESLLFSMKKNIRSSMYSWINPFSKWSSALFPVANGTCQRYSSAGCHVPWLCLRIWNHQAQGNMVEMLSNTQQ